MRVVYAKGVNPDGTGGLRKAVDYSGLPEHMRDGARRWIEQGQEAGGFLRAVCQNQLLEAFQRADMVNQARMLDWARWLEMECPMRARGDGVVLWKQEGGLFGLGFTVLEGGE